MSLRDFAADSVAVVLMYSLVIPVASGYFEKLLDFFQRADWFSTRIVTW